MWLQAQSGSIKWEGAGRGKLPPPSPPQKDSAALFAPCMRSEIALGLEYRFCKKKKKFFLHRKASLRI